MRILSIGNSFSQDAQRYIHDVAKGMGIRIDTANLYIGGCSLETHYNNMLDKGNHYRLEFNGAYTGFCVSIEHALTIAGPWDVITLQQVSHQSTKYETYEPYLTELAKYIRELAPDAKIVIHQTWAYEEKCQRLTDEMGYVKSADMLADIVTAYGKAEESIDADGIIPSGQMMHTLSIRGVKRVHRDGFHASETGRYALALLWIRMLCGISVAKDKFFEFDMPVDDNERKTARHVVDMFPPIKL